MLSTTRTLSLAYLAYFGVLGVFVPYIGIYLDSRGLDSMQIGTVLAIVTGMRIIGPNVWALLAERQRDPVGVMRKGAVLAVLGWCATLLPLDYWPLVAALALYSFCWTAILPQLETSAFHYLENDTARYSRVRSAGSVGYIILVMLGGYLLQHLGAGFLPASALLFLCLMLVVLWQLPKFVPGAQSTTAPIKFRSLWGHSAFFRFMFAAFLLQISFAPFYSFFTMFCRDLGYTGTQSGLLIAVAVAAEIVAFYFAGKVLQGRSYRVLLGFCYAVTGVRWALTGVLGGSAWVLSALMLLHAFSFAIAHSCAMQFIQQFFPEQQRSRGQALYAGLVYGGGGAVGAYLAGISWQNGQGGVQTFVLAGVVALLAALLAWSLPPSIEPISGQAERP